MFRELVIANSEALRHRAFDDLAAVDESVIGWALSDKSVQDLGYGLPRMLALSGTW